MKGQDPSGFEQIRHGGNIYRALYLGKVQQLRFAGVALKTYPMSKVRETQVRQ